MAAVSAGRQHAEAAVWPDLVVVLDPGWQLAQHGLRVGELLEVHVVALEVFTKDSASSPDFDASVSTDRSLWGLDHPADMPALTEVSFHDCAHLEKVDALLALPNLRKAMIWGCKDPSGALLRVVRTLRARAVDVISELDP
jgi:hypothetical protein